MPEKNERWQEWELHYEHHRDFQAAQCESRGIPVPKEERYGELKLLKDIWRRFNGDKFWPLFESNGHDSAIFEGCKCRTKWNKLKK